MSLRIAYIPATGRSDIQTKENPTENKFSLEFLHLYVIPLGLISSIPVGWRQPSYKTLKGVLKI